jgi:hypothetical protein
MDYCEVRAATQDLDEARGIRISGIVIARALAAHLYKQ